jgi:signal transduction histidine kinase
VLGSGLRVDSISDIESLLIAMSSNTIAILLLLLPFLMARFIWIKKGSPDFLISLFSLIKVGAILGALKGYLTWVIMGLIGGGDLPNSHLATITATAMMVGSLIIPAAAFFNHYQQMQREAREKLLFYQGLLNLKDTSPIVLQSFINKVKINLKEGAQNLTLLEEEIRNIIEKELRPLSQRLWLKEVATLPNFTISEIIRIGIPRYAYSFWIVPIWAITSLSTTLEILGVYDGLLVQLFRIVIFAVAIIILKYIAKSIGQHNFNLSLLLYLLSTISISVLLVYFGSLFSETNNLNTDFGLVVINTIWLFQLTFIILMVRATLYISGLIKKAKGTEYTEEEQKIISENKSARLEDRQVAKFLHGHVQSKMNALANDIRDYNLKQGTMLTQDHRNLEDTINEKISLIEKTLDEALQHYNSKKPEDLKSMIQQVNLDWAELIKLSFTISKSLGKETVKLDPNLLTLLEEIINEGISNALRHGLASEVHISITPLSVSLLDNGIGLRKNLIPGLGSLYLDAISASWEIGNAQEGTLLTVLFKKY